MRSAAVWAASRFGNRLVPLLTAMVSSEDRLLRLSAIECLGTLGSRAADAAAVLERSVDDPDGEVSAAAVNALKEIRSELNGSRSGGKKKLTKKMRRPG